MIDGEPSPPLPDLALAALVHVAGLERMLYHGPRRTRAARRFSRPIALEPQDARPGEEPRDAVAELDQADVLRAMIGRLAEDMTELLERRAFMDALTTRELNRQTPLSQYNVRGF